MQCNLKVNKLVRVCYLFLVVGPKALNQKLKANTGAAYAFGFQPAGLCNVKNYPAPYFVRNFCP
jgi:hypothetical protein